jgi:tRNA-2-methylthio-N6-dimethylallyladenosine synthase
MKKKSYHLKTFGCQMNKSDSERIAAVMTKAGYQPAPLRTAAVVIFNTCSVRQSAEDRAAGQIREAKKRGQKVVVTGCLKNQPSFVSKQNAVAIFVDIKEIAALPAKIEGRDNKNVTADYFDIVPQATDPTQSYVPVMTGCNNYCGYCIVPYLRGPEKSRPPQKIIKEIETLVASGCRQITLLGQNVNSYSYGRTNFPALLEKIARLPGDWRLFFVTSHPKDFTDQLIKLVAKHDKLCPYFHLPLQSGSDRILKAMNRQYRVSDYLKIIAQIRQAIPAAAITTDIIVGYPGETKADFLATAKVCEQAQYDLAYIARYSPRPGTAAAKLSDDVSPTEKKRREKYLLKITDKSARAQNKKLVGRKTAVLVEKSQAKGNKYINYGKNEFFKTVKFSSSKNLIYQMVPVKITRALTWGLYGEKQ